MSAPIIAIVSMHKDIVAGGAPIFIANGPEELQQLAFMLEKITDAMAHDLKNGTIVLVQH